MRKVEFSGKNLSRQENHGKLRLRQLYEEKRKILNQLEKLDENRKKQFTNKSLEEILISKKQRDSFENQKEFSGKSRSFIMVDEDKKLLKKIGLNPAEIILQRISLQRGKNWLKYNRKGIFDPRTHAFPITKELTRSEHHKFEYNVEKTLKLHLESIDTALREIHKNTAKFDKKRVLNKLNALKQIITIVENEVTEKSVYSLHLEIIRSKLKIMDKELLVAPDQYRTRMWYRRRWKDMYLIGRIDELRKESHKVLKQISERKAQKKDQRLIKTVMKLDDLNKEIRKEEVIPNLQNHTTMGSNKCCEQNAEEDYLDDPITLVQDVTAVVYTTKEADALAVSQKQITVTNDEVGSNEKNCGEPKTTSTLEGTSAYGKKNTYMPPLTFFDNSRNVRLLNQCRPMSIQIIDFVKNPRCIKTKKAPLSKRKPPYRSSLSLKRKTSIASVRVEDFETIRDCNLMNNITLEKVLSSDKAVSLEIINDSVIINDTSINTQVKNKHLTRDQSVINVQDNPKAEIYYKYASSKSKHISSSGIAKSSEGNSFSKIDYKRNKGLVGLKINRISESDLNPCSKECTPSNKSNLTKTDTTDQGNHEKIGSDANISAQKEHNSKVVCNYEIKSKENGIQELKSTKKTNETVDKTNECNKEKNENSMVCKLKVHPNLISTSLMDKFNIESSEQNSKDTKESDEYRINIDSPRKNVKILQVFYPRNNNEKSKVSKDKTDDKKNTNIKKKNTSKNRRIKKKDSCSKNLKSDKIPESTNMSSFESKGDLQDTTNLSYVGKTVFPFEKSYPPGLSNIDVDSTMTDSTIKKLLRINRDQPCNFSSQCNNQNSLHSFGDFMNLLYDQTDKIPNHNEVLIQSNNHFSKVNKEPPKSNVIQPSSDKTSLIHKNGETSNITPDKTEKLHQYSNKDFASYKKRTKPVKTDTQKVPTNNGEKTRATHSKQCELKVQTVTQINNKIGKAIDQTQRNIAVVMEAPKQSDPVQRLQIKKEVEDNRDGSKNKSSDLVTQVPSTTYKHQTNNSENRTQHTKFVSQVYSHVSSSPPDRSKLQANNMLYNIDDQLPSEQNSTNVRAPNTTSTLQGNNIAKLIPPKENINVVPNITATNTSVTFSNSYAYSPNESQNFTNSMPSYWNHQNINPQSQSYNPAQRRESFLTPQNWPIQYMQSRTNSAQTTLNPGIHHWQQPYQGDIHKMFKQPPPPYDPNFINRTDTNNTDNTYNFSNVNNYYPYLAHTTFLAPPPQPPPLPPPLLPPLSTPLAGAQHINLKPSNCDKNTLKRYCLKAVPINSGSKSADQILSNAIINSSNISLPTVIPAQSAGAAALLRNVILGKIIAIRKPSPNPKKRDRSGDANLIETKKTKMMDTENTKVLSENITPGGYSPPILPIPSIKKSLELLSLINSNNTKRTENKTEETKGSGSSPKSKRLNDTLEEINKRKNVVVDHSKNTKMKIHNNRKEFKKISLEEYKKRSSDKFHGDKCIDLTDDDTDENKVKERDMNPYIYKNNIDIPNVKRHSLDSQDLGYDSDTTVKL